MSPRTAVVTACRSLTAAPRIASMRDRDLWRSGTSSTTESLAAGSPAGAMGAIRSRLLDDGDADAPITERSGSLPAPPPGLPQRINGGDKPWQRAWRGGGGGEETAAPAGSPGRGRVRSVACLPACRCGAHGIRGSARSLSRCGVELLLRNQGCYRGVWHSFSQGAQWLLVAAKRPQARRGWSQCPQRLACDVRVDLQGAMERGGMPVGPRGPPGPGVGRGRGMMGPPAEWNGRASSAEQRGGFMQRAPSAGAAVSKTHADRFLSESALKCCPAAEVTTHSMWRNQRLL